MSQLAIKLRTALAAPRPEPEPQECWCHKCNSGRLVDYMILCPICGCKRCPKASDHELTCTSSNEPGQPGSVYTLPAAAPEKRHPGYVIGSHWLETAYSRICAGEAEADVLKDCGWERVADIDALLRDVEALWRDAELGRWIREETPPIEEIAARVDAMEDET